MDHQFMTNWITQTVSSLVLAVVFCGCSREQATKTQAKSSYKSLVLALAVLDDSDGNSKTLPGQLEILSLNEGQWVHRALEDTNNNVFHKAMAYGTNGVLT